MPDKILIIDDEPDIRGAAKMILEGEGFLITIATNGDEGIEKAEKEIPDLILLDLVMPGKSGLETCQILKSKPKIKHIPVVTFSVLGRDVDRKLTQDAGADGHLVKPFTPDGLTSAINQQLDLSKPKKFFEQVGAESSDIKGKKFLFEFDPFTPYERLIRDFAIGSIANKEAIVVLSPSGTSVRKSLENEKNVKIIDLTPDTMMSSIISENPKGPLNLIYDSLTDLILSTQPQSAYLFVRNSLKLMSDPRITSLFLLNPSAHEEKDVYGLRGLFSSRIVYGKDGVSSLKLT
ncbi:MAG: response regulator [Candidatus Bathyarchaeia archaeon]